MFLRALAFAALAVVALLLVPGSPANQPSAEERPAAQEEKKTAPATDKAAPEKDKAAPSTEKAGAAAEKPAPGSENAEPVKTYPEQDPAKGALEGKITFEGQPPEDALKPIEVPAAHQDRAACVSHVKNEKLVLSEKKDIKNVLISVAGYQPAEKVKPRKAHLDNKHCTFVPHLQATTVGSTLEITNSDGFIHNTQAVLALSFNVAIPAGGKEEKPMKKAGRAVVNCSFHSWMQANIWIFSHDLFDTTGPDGAFKIPNIPPGEYEIDVWHEILAPQKIKVKIEAGKTARLDLALRRREK